MYANFPKLRHWQAGSITIHIDIDTLAIHVMYLGGGRGRGRGAGQVHKYKVLPNVAPLIVQK